MRGAPVALRQPVFSRLTPRCHVRVASPIPVTAGRFFRRKAPEKPQNPIRGGPCPLERPRCSVDVPLWWNTKRGKSFVRRKVPEKPHNLIRGGPCPLEHPRCSVDVPLCGIRSAAKALFGALRLKNRRIQFEAGLAPRALPLLCGCSLVWNTERGKSFIRRIAPEKPHNLIRGGSCPLGRRAPLSSFSCVEYGARQKQRPPRTAKRRRRERACPCRSR